MAVLERIRCPVCGTPRIVNTYWKTYELSKSLQEIGGGNITWVHDIPLSRAEALFIKKRVEEALAAINQALGPEEPGDSAGG